MTSTNDGFKIAEEDLAMRGPGDLHGTQQSGVLKFKLADIVKDGSMLNEARMAAQDVLAHDPDLKTPEYIRLRKEIHQQPQQSNWSKII